MNEIEDSAARWLRSHVEVCLRGVVEDDVIRPDSHGEYAFDAGPAAGFVRVEWGYPPAVRVYAIAVESVPRSSKLFAEINAVNARSHSAHVYWSDQRLVVEQVLYAHGLTAVAMECACSAVAQVASDVGPLLSALYGGTTPYPLEFDGDGVTTT